MSRPLALGDVVKAQVICFETVNTSQVSINTTYWRVKNVVGAGIISVDDFGHDFNIAMSAIYKALLCNDSSFRGVRVQAYHPLPLERAVPFTNLAGVGIGGANLLPPQVAFVVSFPTAVAKIRGRNYLPFPAAAEMDADGTPTAGYLGNVQVLLNFLQAGISIAKAGTTFNFGQVICKPYVNARPKAVPPTPLVPSVFTDVVDWTARDGFGTQRRRGFYGRSNSLPI